MHELDNSRLFIEFSGATPMLRGEPPPYQFRPTRCDYCGGGTMEPQCHRCGGPCPPGRQSDKQGVILVNAKRKGRSVTGGPR